MITPVGAGGPPCASCSVAFSPPEFLRSTAQSTLILCVHIHTTPRPASYVSYVQPLLLSCILWPLLQQSEWPVALQSWAEDPPRVHGVLAPPIP